MFVGEAFYCSSPRFNRTGSEIRRRGETFPPTVLKSEQLHSVAVKLRLSLTVA